MTYEEYNRDIQLLADKIIESNRYKQNEFSGIYPIPRGGYYPAIMLSNLLKLPLQSSIENNSLIVDDICDTGATLSEFAQAKAVVYSKLLTINKVDFVGTIFDSWLDIPDEKGCGIEDHVRRILEYIGENPNRDGLIDTPKRIVKMWKEIFRGYDETQKPKITVFDNGTDGIVYDNMVIDNGNFYSMCEHHAMPFFGKYVFAYIPNAKGKIIGLSKIARVVDFYAAKLQIQERLGSDILNEIAAALGEDNPPLGMAIYIEGEHLCKSMRGVKKQGKMSTSVLRGVFKEKETRAEFLQLIR